MQIYVEGNVSDIRYQKETKNGGYWNILLFSVSKVDRGVIPDEFGKPPMCTIKLVGFSTFPLLEGKIYKVLADEDNNTEYGRQYKIEAVTEVLEAGEADNIWEYLACELTDTQYKALFAGKEMVDIPTALANSDITELSKLKGVGPTTAIRIIKRYNDGLAKMEQIVLLKNMGFSQAVRKSLMRLYPNTQDVIRFCNQLKQNFYVIMNKVKGFGWARTDKMAREHHGYTETCKERIQAFVLYWLDETANTKGHSWITRDNLIDAIYSVAPNIQGQQIAEYLADMLNHNLLYYDRETKRIGSQVLHDVEEATAKEMFRLIDGTDWELENIEEAIKQSEEEKGFEYTDEQQAVILAVAKKKVAVVTGCSGVGKSSVMLPIVKALKASHKPFAMVALSGKAALNIGVATDATDKAMTIHRLLGFMGGGNDDEDDGNKDASSVFEDDTEKEMIGRPMGYPRDAEGKLLLDFLIVDEVSMIGGYLFRRLIEALPDRAKVVFIGDEGQLEAIGYANILWDMKKSGVVPYYTLTKIMRQAARSGIITDSTKIYRKEQFIPADLLEETVHGELQDFKIIPVDSGAEVKEKLIAEYTRFIKLGISPEDIMVVTQKRAKGELASVKVNNFLQKIANPLDTEEKITTNYKDSGEEYTITYKVKDQVMMIKNDYHVPLERPQMATTPSGRPYWEKEVAVLNGNIGQVVAVEKGCLIVKFPQGTVRMSRGLIEKLQLGYAATCHKLQGSGIPYVIGIVDPGAYTLLTNEALYTEITRAKKYCTLIGSVVLIRGAVKKTQVKGKQTWLTELLRAEYLKRHTEF